MSEGNGKGRPGVATSAVPGRKGERTAELAAAFYIGKWGPPTFAYAYRQDFLVYRWNLPGGDKQVRPVHRAEDGWHMGDPPGPLPLYRWEQLADADLVYVVEGEKCVEIAETLGVVATTSAHGAQSARRTDWSPLAGKEVIVLPDHENGEGYAADVCAILHELDPRPDIRVLRLPGLDQGEDIEQWLAGSPEEWTPGDCRAELERLWHDLPTWSPPAREPPRQAGYRAFGNFTARIIREIIRHEAGETRRHIEVEATHEDGTASRATIPAGDFATMAWVDTDLGLKYAIHPGRSMKDQFQHSIRMASIAAGIETVHVHTALGWERMGDRDVYLHAGGAIGAAPGTRIELDVPPELALLKLPAPDPARLGEAVKAVLRIPEYLGEAAAPIAAILMALPFRAVLGPSRCIPHFGGTTGSFKTSTACLALRFFAPGVEYDDSMPLSWSATAAGLERVRHLARDTLLVIDNLIADGKAADKELAKADTVFNSQGDLTGRARMSNDGTTKPRIDPRGSIISTGECEPQRRSAAGRGMIVQFHPGAIALDGLKHCHEDARAELYAQAIACYAAWIADGSRLADLRQGLRTLAHSEQATVQALHPGCHPRHAEAVAEWSTAFELFMDFAMISGVVDEPTARAAVDQVREGLRSCLAAQAGIQEQLDPAETFLEMIASLLASQQVYLSGRDGLMPSTEVAAACGWRRVQTASSDWDTAPGAVRIGWIDEDWIYLDPPASHAAAERLAHQNGRTLGTVHQVRTRLAETKKIRIDDVCEEGNDERKRFTPRVRVEKRRVRTLWLKHESLFEASPEEPSDGPAY